jgi:hypothetical protein
MAAFDEARHSASQLGFADPTTDSQPDEVLAAFYGEWPPTVPWWPMRPIPARPPLTSEWTFHDTDSDQSR